ncbi:hypothetical protein DPMN_125720 [Dreissena polymorpha]|uniref:Uncharacterized protein n=1 Tax=Dreissena polymorpha TaxID=45954 RepID=A0A9D4JTB8_DREPO|nr:hypothetical protein DPMN_125720 [Dreissena polymorpha]
MVTLYTACTTGLTGLPAQHSDPMFPGTMWEETDVLRSNDNAIACFCPGALYVTSLIVRMNI